MLKNIIIYNCISTFPCMKVVIIIFIIVLLRLRLVYSVLYACLYIHYAYTDMLYIYTMYNIRNICIHTYIRTYIHTYIHTYTHTYIHNIHIHIYTYTGMMVKEFDQIVFEAEVGKVHGPIATQFGSHLIYITRRFEGDESKK